MASTIGRISVVIMAVLLALCTSCAVGEDLVATETLRPYRTERKTPTQEKRSPTLASQAPLGPTPTPLVHVVQKDQTLIGIAILYGIDLEDLILANPGIDPGFLSIGAELIIPSEGGQPVDALLPTPTPVSLALSTVQCYPTTSDGLWCLMSVANETTNDVEGVVSLVYLLDHEGAVLDRGLAYAPLNRLQAGSRMPMAVFFPSPPEGMQAAVASMLSAVPVNEAGSRYREVDVQIDSQDASPEGMSWRVRGELHTDAEEDEAEITLRLLLNALDRNNKVIGFRVCEPGYSVKSGETIAFDCTVFSFNQVIDDVEVMVEGRVVP